MAALESWLHLKIRNRGSIYYFEWFQGWKEQVGKVYRRCLQVHPDKVDIRISSARYELDLAMADERSDASAAADSGLRVENARFVVSIFL